MHHLDLFSGIGGFAVALQLAGIPINKSFHSDIEPYANSIYSKNFPGSEQLGDIRGINGRHLREQHGGPWMLTGGFPCQDVSNAGHRKGLAGERSGLWFEMLRVITELQPELVYIENVAALRRRGLIEVLRGLDAAGYDSEWRTVSAAECGAIHKRERLWIIAWHADETPERTAGQLSQSRRDMGNSNEPHSATDGLLSRAEWAIIKAERSLSGQPLVARKDDGLRSWVDRIRCLGNAIVPQVAARVLTDWIDKHTYP